MQLFDVLCPYTQKMGVDKCFSFGKKGDEMQKPFWGYWTDPYEMKWDLYILQNSETKCKCKENAGRGGF